MTVKSVIFSPLVAAALLLSGTHVARAAEAQTQPQTEKAVPKASTPASVPAAEKARQNPVPAVPEAIELGKILFKSQCGMCHGATGDGRGDLVGRLGLKMPNFTDPQQQGKRTDGEYFYIITRGHGQMPGEGDRLPPQQKWEIIRYIWTLVPPTKPGS